MRTTLEIDARVLAAARGRVQAGVSSTLGAAVSELALAGLEMRMDVSFPPGIILVPSVPGHIVTSAMVEAALADA